MRFEASFLDVAPQVHGARRMAGLTICNPAQRVEALFAAPLAGRRAFLGLPR